VKIVKKKLIISLLFVIVTVLGACNNSSNDEVDADNENTNNLINTEELVEGEWIDTKGEHQENAGMYHTQSIDYSSSNEYALFANSYVSYYNAEEFIKTIRYSGEVKDIPHNLESVEDADNVILSFSEQWVDEIELIKE